MKKLLKKFIVKNDKDNMYYRLVADSENYYIFEVISEKEKHYELVRIKYDMIFFKNDISINALHFGMLLRAIGKMVALEFLEKQRKVNKKIE